MCVFLCFGALTACSKALQLVQLRSDNLAVPRTACGRCLNVGKHPGVVVS